MTIFLHILALFLLDILLIAVLSWIVIAIMERGCRGNWKQKKGKVSNYFCRMREVLKDDWHFEKVEVLILIISISLVLIVACLLAIYFPMEKINWWSIFEKCVNEHPLFTSILGTFIGVLVVFIILKPRVLISKNLDTLETLNGKHLKVRARNIGLLSVNNVEVQLLFYREKSKDGTIIKKTKRLELLRPDTPMLSGILPLHKDSTYGCATKLTIDDLIESRKSTIAEDYEGIICRVKATHAISGVTFVREHIFEKDVVDEFFDKYKNSKRVTALLGAGVNMGLNLPFKPSTYYLTEKVVNATYAIFDTETNGRRESNLVPMIYRTICENYSEGALDPNTSYNKVHFEILFHVLETLYSYIYYKENQSKGKTFPYDNVPPFACLVNISVEYSSSEIKQVMKEFITIIMDQVNEYNNYYKKNIKSTNNKLFHDFWAESPGKLDIFTLNYDTTIENSLPSYEDGFMIFDDKYDFKRFVPKKLFHSKDNTINHLHGSILYGAERIKDDKNRKIDTYLYSFDDYYCWNTYDSARRFWVNSSRSDIQAQNHEVIFPSPIITGLNKTNKIIWLPFNAYKYNFSRKVMNNNALLIAGYSFGDYYLNQEIERMRQYHGDKWRVVIIDYWELDDSDDMSDIDKLRNYLWNNNARINKDMVRLILKVANESYFDGSIFVEKGKGQFVSKNGQLMLFVNGMNAALKHKKEICEFLNSK